MIDERTGYWATIGTAICIMVILLILSNVSAASITYAQNSDVNLKYPCINNETYCTSAAYCNITIFDPNNDVVINNQAMTNSGAWHNYTLNETQTALIGTYQDSMICNDGGLQGYSTFTHDITRTGEATKDFDVLPLIIAFIAALIVIITVSVVSGKKHPAISVLLAVLALFLLNPMVQVATLFVQDNFRSALFSDNISVIQQIIVWIGYISLIYIIIYIMVSVISNYNKRKQAKLDGLE